MLSGFFMSKTSDKCFSKHMEDLFKKFENKKVLIYGAGNGFEYLNKKYDFKKLDVVALSDMKFTKEDNFKGFRAISPEMIKNEKFDYILITNEKSERIFNYLQNELQISKEIIDSIFENTSDEEKELMDYAAKFKFEKRLKKINKQLKNKKIIIYGAGLFFQTLHKNYDFNSLNIIGIADRKFIEHNEGETFLNYKVFAPDEIKESGADCVLVANKFSTKIIEDLYDYQLNNTKIKIKSLLNKPILTLIKEIWEFN